MLKSRRAIVPVVLLVISLVGQGRAWAQAQRSVTLDEIQKLAVGYYQTVGIARARAGQARQAERQAHAARLPVVATQAILTRNLVTGSLTFNDMRIDILPPIDYTLTVAAVQPLFTGFRLQKGQRQAELGVDVAITSVGITVQDTVLAATRAYYMVLGEQENVEISRRAVAVAEETRRSAESLVRAGEAVETSVLRARVAVSDAMREQLVAETALVLARQQLTLLTGVTGDFQVVRPEPPRRPEEPVEALVLKGLAGRPELKALGVQRQIAGLEIERRRGEWYPTVQAEAMYQKRRATFPSSQLASVAVNAAWQVFDGGRRGASIADATLALNEAALQEDLARQRTAEEIRAAYLAIDALNASVGMLTAQVDFARRNADETARAYKIGEATDLDVLQSNSSLTESERQLVLTTYQLEMAIYTLQRAVGTFAADLVPATTGGRQ